MQASVQWRYFARMPDLQAQLRRLAQTDRHIRESEVRAADMASRIAQREARSEDVTQAVEVLTLIRASQECLRSHRDMTLDAIARAEAANDVPHWVRQTARMTRRFH
jgi:hypothetical protein